MERGMRKEKRPDLQMEDVATLIHDALAPKIHGAGTPWTKTARRLALTCRAPTQENDAVGGEEHGRPVIG
jgi:hypothetical protein